MVEFGFLGFVLCFVGLLTLFSSAYEWSWWSLQFNRVDVRERFGPERARLINLGGGFLFLSIGAVLVIHLLLGMALLVALLIGLGFSAVATKLIYESREGQSVSELIRFNMKQES